MAETNQSAPKRRFVVTGGGGFLGKAICKALLAQGAQVVSVARGDYPELRELGIQTVRADIGEPLSMWPTLDGESLFSGVSGVFHTAAKVDMWGKREEFVRANIVGTQNIIEACKLHKVKALVFTSSPSVIHTGSNLIGVNEDLPYPKHFEAYYPETKAVAEREALGANTDSLNVTALRPHLIWGPGDTNLIPAVLERARSGALMQVGDGGNLVDLTFIEDCVQAHLKAMEILLDDPVKIAGKPYFISQGEPVQLWSWINSVLAAHQLPPIKKKVSLALASKLATVFEVATKFFNTCGWDIEPRMTRFLVSEMGTSHYFDISRARRDLGYEPKYSMEEAMKKTFGAS